MGMISRCIDGIKVTNRGIGVPFKNTSLFTYASLYILFLIGVNCGAFFILHEELGFSALALELPDWRMLFALHMPAQDWMGFFIKYCIVGLVMILICTVSLLLSVALIQHVIHLAHHHTTTIRASLHAAGAKFWRILVIALVTALVSTLWIATGEFMFEGSMIPSLVGWALATELLVLIWRFILFFMLPVIARENVSVWHALKTSLWIIIHRIPELIGAGFWFMIFAAILRLLLIVPLILIFGFMGSLAKIISILLSIYLQTVVTSVSAYFYDSFYRQQVKH